MGARAAILAAAGTVIVIVGCGGEPAQTSKAQAVPDDAPLLELSIRPDRGVRGGLRVLGDGRLELLGDAEIDAEGQPDPGQAPREWRVQWTYTDAELAELRRAIAAANSPPLDDRYERPGGVSHPTTLVWRLRLPDEVKEVTILKYTPGLVPALDTLYRRIFEIHKEPAGSSVWRVRVGEEIVQREVACEPASVPELRAMVSALFVRESGGREDGAGSPGRAPEADPLVEITWKTEGQVTERTLVYPDGRHVRVEGGKEVSERAFSRAEIATLEAAIRETDWPSLPDPICPPGQR